MTMNELSQAREYLKELATEQLRTKKALRAAIDGIIERTTSEEQLGVLNLGIIKAGLASNPHQYAQLDNGNWLLLERVVDNPDEYRQLDDGRWAHNPSSPNLSLVPPDPA